jgi:hypothetical protein
MKYLAAVAGVCMMAASGGVYAQSSTQSVAEVQYQPTVDDWVGVNAAVNNYTLGLELNDLARFEKAFWPEATVIVQPEPGVRFTMPFMAIAAGPQAGPPPGMPPGPPPGMPPAGAGGMMPPPGAMPPNMPPPPAAGAPMTNAIGNNLEPWHLSLSHAFEFQSPTRATHYGYFVSVYPDPKTKVTTVGLPGHYEDVLEKRNGEWRILQRTTVIGVK